MAGLLHTVLLGALACTALANFPNAFPCPGPKGRQGTGATCKEVKLPDDLCSSCYLRPPLPNGKFAVCSRIYQTENDKCMDSMNKYVEYNQCDGNRKKVMNILNQNPKNHRARQDLDYFIYSVCEQCCDCIPMGVTKAHVGATVADRGNCPAHAWYDVCAVLPQVTHFVKIGEETPQIFKNNPPSACMELAGWKNSKHFANWQKNPKTKISGSLRAALNSMLHSTSCSSQSVWDKCFNLESVQKNLGIPGTFDGTNKNWNSNKNTNCNNGDCSSNTSSNEQSNSSSGEKKCGECKGTVKPGCTNFDAAKKQCTAFGLKCFPSDGGQSYSVEGCAGGNNNNSKNNSGNHSSNNSKNNSQNNSQNSSQNSSNSNNGLPSCADCPGQVMYGCTHYDAKQGKCTSTGDKCFPKSGSNNGYGCKK